MISWDIKLYTPMEKDALMVAIESCLGRAKNGFTMVGVSVMIPNKLTLNYANNFVDNMDDLLTFLMDKSLTCSIADVNTGLDDGILFLTLVATDNSTTNIDSDVMNAISKLSFRG